MALHPKIPKDLALAPLAAGIDMNLQRLRDKSPREIELELELELDRPARSDTEEERAARVLEVALRNLDEHDWKAEITDDRAGLRLSGGSVSLDVGLSASLLRYIVEGGGTA